MGPSTCLNSEHSKRATVCERCQGIGDGGWREERSVLEQLVRFKVPEGEDTHPKPDDGNIGNSTSGLHTDALHSEGFQDDSGQSATVPVPPITEEEVTDPDTEDRSEHEHLHPTTDDLSQSCCGLDEQTGDTPKAAWNKGRLEINTFIYILADYIQIPELKALAVRKFAAILEGDCQYGLGDLCHLVYRTAPSTAFDLRSCLANSIASCGPQLILE